MLKFNHADLDLVLMKLSTHQEQHKRSSITQKYVTKFMNQSTEEGGSTRSLLRGFLKITTIPPFIGTRKR